MTKFLVATGIAIISFSAYAVQEGDDCTEKSKLGENFICRESGVVLDCRNADGKANLALCSYKAFEKSDRALNVAYQKVLKSLQKPKDENSDYKEARRRLIEAQKIWVKFRDLECSINEAFNLYGSVQAAETEICRKELTEKRIKEIQGYSR